MLAFSLALVGLWLCTRYGVPTAVTMGALIVYVAVATLWVRQQYADAQTPAPWAMPLAAVACFCILGVVLFVIWLITGAGGLGVLGLFVFWIGGGALVARMRNPPRRDPIGPAALRPFLPWIHRQLTQHRLRAAVTLVLVTAGMILTGTGLLGHGALSPALLGPAVLIVLPVGLAIGSQLALDSLSSAARADGRRMSSLLLGGGLAVFAVITGVSVAFADTWLVAVPFGVLLGFILASVSSTDADVAIVIAVIALVGVTPPQANPTASLTSTDPKKPMTFVALGDSYMSGEGASVYFKDTNNGRGNQCRRAPTAWAVRAATSPLPGLRNGGFDKIEFLACSGARSFNVLETPRSGATIPKDPALQQFRDSLDAVGPIGPQKNGDLRTQLDQWKIDQKERNLAAGAVVISIGGNDAGFSAIGQMCLAPGNCANRQDLWFSVLGQVRQRLRLTYAEIDETFPTTPVFVIPYPDPIATSIKKCGQVALEPAERTFIHNFVSHLDTAIQETAAEYRFHYVDTMQNALASTHLQLCDPLNRGQPGLNLIAQRSVRGLAEQQFNPANWIHNSLHPNARGHAAMLQAFQTWLATQAKIEARTTATPQTQNAASRLQRGLGALAETPLSTTERQAQNYAGQCNLDTPDKTNCRTEANAWTLARTRQGLWWPGIPIIAISVFAAWCTAIGFFSLIRRRAAATT